MFEDDEVDGIVCTHTHFLFSMYIYVCKIGSIGCKESAFFFDLPKNFELYMRTQKANREKELNLSNGCVQDCDLCWSKL